MKIIALVLLCWALLLIIIFSALSRLSIKNDEKLTPNIPYVEGTIK